MKILETLKKLPQGYYRLLITGWIILPFLVAFIGVYYFKGLSDFLENFCAAYISAFIIYYIMARNFVWIYEGFKNQNN